MEDHNCRLLKRKYISHARDLHLFVFHEEVTNTKYISLPYNDRSSTILQDQTKKPLIYRSFNVR
jgi:hypothetical protein